jgi:glutamate-5-semialdehyde dehydrogenase
MSAAQLALLQGLKRAKRALASAPLVKRQAALHALAQLLRAAADPASAVLQANQQDVAQASAQGLAEPLLDRLRLSAERLMKMAADVDQVATLPDPIFSLLEARTRSDGLRIERVRVPLGVLAIIFEARPNVTIDCAALAIMSGNAALLRGGKEANQSNMALFALVRAALSAADLPMEAICVWPAGPREELAQLLQHDTLLDVVIPRGGAGLHAYCKQVSRVPVLSGGVGICHMYWHHSADAKRALAVLLNAKVQRPSVCNALDVLLLDHAASAQLPAIVAALRAHQVLCKLCPAALAIVGAAAGIEAAEPEDFSTEWLSLTISIKLVADADAAFAHIQNHSSGHSDALLAHDAALWQRFRREIDSAAIYYNASTRFTDGAELGLGAEIAVSTERLHARGPMGLNELMSSKWIVQGDYHVRA